jgi:hypothetical protein
MKSFDKFVGTLSAMAFTFTLLTSQVSQAADQVKGGEKMMRSMKPIKTAEDIQSIKDGDMVAMACPQCKTITYKYVDRSVRGANKELNTATKDTCPACDTKIVSTGVGKPAKNEVQHTCKMCGSHDAFCCVLSKEARTQ